MLRERDAEETKMSNKLKRTTVLGGLHALLCLRFSQVFHNFAISNARIARVARVLLLLCYVGALMHHGHACGDMTGHPWGSHNLIPTLVSKYYCWKAPLIYISCLTCLFNRQPGFSAPIQGWKKIRKNCAWGPNAKWNLVSHLSGAPVSGWIVWTNMPG